MPLEGFHPSGMLTSSSVLYHIVTGNSHSELSRVEERRNPNLERDSFPGSPDNSTQSPGFCRRIPGDSSPSTEIGMHPLFRTNDTKFGPQGQQSVETEENCRRLQLLGLYISSREFCRSLAIGRSKSNLGKLYRAMLKLPGLYISESPNEVLRR